MVGTTLWRPARVNPVLRHSREQRLALDGKWEFCLDPDDEGEGAGWWQGTQVFPERIEVPGCWQGQGFGGDSLYEVRDFRLRAQVFRSSYEGTGWYQRRFTVPDTWRNRHLWLHFGGAHPAAQVWVNGHFAGENDLPFVPFGFDLTPFLEPDTEAVVTVRVHEHNRLYGLAYNWQGPWSGLYRGVDVGATGATFFTRCFTAAQPDLRHLHLRGAVAGEWAGAQLQVVVRKAGSGQVAASETLSLTDAAFDWRVAVDEVEPWSPDNPCLYHVEISLWRAGELCDARAERTGWVRLEADGRHLCINGEPYYWRGTGDFISCPETGSPDTDRERWRRKLRALRDYGYNYVRCQSFVYGPEYFDAADEVGLLVQSEMGMLGAWGGTSLWHGYAWPPPTADHYATLKAQWDYTVERDSHHPSANLYCMSNELGDNTFFPRAAWQCYHDTKNIKPSSLVIWTDGGFNADLPGDFINDSSGRVAFPATKPLIEHEFRWWSSFPDIRLRERYAGAIRPYAMDIACEAARREGQEDLLEQYATNSQRLQYLEARAKLEIQRRDHPDLAGICHFDAMDTNPSPQGILNGFYERKLVTAKQWLRTNGDTVILPSLGFEDRCREAGSRLQVSFAVSDFGHPPLSRPVLKWELVTNKVIGSGQIEWAHKPFVTCPVGVMECVLPELNRAVKATLRVTAGDDRRTIENEWDLWIFPRLKAPEKTMLWDEPRHTWLKQWDGLLQRAATLPQPGEVTLLTESVDSEVGAWMEAGGRVVLAAGEAMLRPHAPLFGVIRYFFTPPANYPPYEDGQNGTLIREHPCLGNFPHEGWAEWPFYRMMENAPPLDLKAPGLDGQDPVIRVIHRYPALRPLGYLVAQPVGAGMLITCALELCPDWVEASYLLRQLCREKWV